MFNRSDFFDDAKWQKIVNTADSKINEGMETPFLILDLEGVKNKYKQIESLFPTAKIHYAVKACPEVKVIQLLTDLGSNFDCASIYEMDRALDCGCEPNRISFGNTIKKAKHIKYAYDKGIRLFATDCESDIKNIAEYAPNSKVFVRILVEGTDTAQWPLSRKFGCTSEMAINLLIQAKELGLDPAGVSFHVGSQQRDVGVWDEALDKVKHITDHLLEKADIKLKLINLGGGFPANYLEEVNPTELYASEIFRYLSEDYSEDEMPELIIEPGRAMAGDSGVLISEVMMISQKSYTDMTTWVYTDTGVFHGLIETVDEVLRYPIYSPKMDAVNGTAVEMKKFVMAGPTCDSMDIMYENDQYPLPANLEQGDRLYWLAAGAYTTSYSSVDFNGFPPLKAVFLED